MEEFISNVEKWATDRGIYQHSTSTAQLLKAISEIGELADAHAKKNRYEFADAIGDVIVCLVNYCAMEQLDLEECCDSAWDQIKDRKGKMIEGGVFVKEG